MVEDKLMPIMKENFLRHAHDTTFNPTGLYNFVKGSELNDSSGTNPAKNLTEYNAAVDDSDFIFGQAEGLSHFSYYRNDASDFQYTGAMSFCGLVNVQKLDTDAPNDNVAIVVCDSGGGGNDARFSLYFNPDHKLRYFHQNGGNNYDLIANSVVRSRHTWSHVAFTRDSNGTGIKIYLNGEQVGAGTLGSPPGTQGTGYLAFGGAHNATNETNDVIISSCAIYNQELTPGQIRYLAQKTLGFSRVD